MARRRSVRGESRGIERAIAEIRELHDRVQRLEGRRQEPVAILGAGLRLPRNLSDQNAFWRLLAAGQNAVTEIPRDRWDANAYHDPNPDRLGKMNARHGAFLEQVNEFDAAFFGISAHEAKIMDPQQRILLEVCWEALENAAIAPSSLAGTAAGVWIGISNSDHWRAVLSDVEAIDRFAVTGNAVGEAAGRLSWMLDTRGPSQVVDTGSSSSLVAVHMACESLRRGESTVALAGGVNLILTPELNIGLSKLHMLAPDGLAKPFDSQANGSVRGEGCVVFALRLLSRALADNDRILAVIRGSAANQNGRTTGWAVPNARAQAALIRRALEAAGVRPPDVAFVEANGAGTLWADSVELQVLEATLCGDRPLTEPLAIASVKTNLGDLEAAGGAAALLKTILALQRRAIPSHLSLRRKNPCIDWRQVPLYIPTDLTPWPKGACYLAGVSSFGYSGTNSHVIVEAPPVREGQKSEPERPLHILALSARREADLEQLVSRYRELIERGDTPAADICYTANAGRTHFAFRFCAIGPDSTHLASQLAQFRGGVHALASPQSPVAFLYPGGGSGYAGMARELYETSPAFRAGIDRCAGLAPSQTGRDLLAALYDPGNALFQRSGSSLPALFAVEYALTELWRSWGIEPAFVAGHGAGEYAAACTAGVISLADGLRLADAWQTLMESLPPGAGVASARSKPLLEDFDRVARKVTFAPPRIPFASTVTGRIMGADAFDRHYWRQARASVQSSEAVDTLFARGARIFLVAGPESPQARIKPAGFPKDAVVHSSLQAGQPNWLQMLETLRALYLSGVRVDWVGFDRDYSRSKIEAPTYPFQRRDDAGTRASAR
jgi:acyl transferase domain-containing protein